MTIEEYTQELLKQNDLIQVANREIDRLKAALVAEHAPVKPGWILEDNQVRILVKRVYFMWDFWEAAGPVLTKNNEPSKRHTGAHTIRVFNLNGPRNTVKIISKIAEIV